MFGRSWQLAEGTLIDVRAVRWAAGGHAYVTHHFLIDVRPSSGAPFRTEVREPLCSSSFIAPSVPGEEVDSSAIQAAR